METPARPRILLAFVRSRVGGRRLVYRKREHVDPYTGPQYLPNPFFADREPISAPLRNDDRNLSVARCHASGCWACECCRRTDFDRDLGPVRRKGRSSRFDPARMWVEREAFETDPRTRDQEENVNRARREPRGQPGRPKFAATSPRPSHHRRDRNGWWPTPYPFAFDRWRAQGRRSRGGDVRRDPFCAREFDPVSPWRMCRSSRSSEPTRQRRGEVGSKAQPGRSARGRPLARRFFYRSSWQLMIDLPRSNWPCRDIPSAARPQSSASAKLTTYVARTKRQSG